MTGMVDVLMDSFRHEARQARVVIDKARMTNSDFVPSKGMRSLIDIVNHLAQIPFMDPEWDSSQLGNEEAIQEREKELYQSDINGALGVFDEGIKSVEKRFSKMTEEEFLEKNLRPLYETGDTKNWAFYLPEMTSHIAMHKMQLWIYLKLSGLEVDMMTYYGVATE